MTYPTTKIEVVVPKKIADKLEEVAKKNNVTKEDLIIRALVKVLEEFEKG